MIGKNGSKLYRLDMKINIGVDKSGPITTFMQAWANKFNKIDTAYPAK